MYCKNCGKQIAEDSKFCSHCGELQMLKQNLTQQEVNSHNLHTIDGVFGLNISKKNVGYYLIWFLINFILLFINWNSNSYANKIFWPFSNDSRLKHYDFTEFVFYTFVPIVILLIVNLLRGSTETKIDELQLKYDLTYKSDETPITVAMSIIFIWLVLLFEGGFKTEIPYPMFRILVFSLPFLRIGILIWVVNIAKKLNRNAIGWGFFAFFLPEISLLIIGGMRKLK